MFKYILCISFFSISASAQNVQWAISVDDIQNVKNEYEDNSFDMALGPPVVISVSKDEKVKHDLYAEGYLIYPDKNRKIQVDFGFKKPTIATTLYIGGLLNQGVVKKCVIILKNQKSKTIFSFNKSKDTTKTNGFKFNFPLETVYGIRLVLDQSKAIDWNVLKGIGIYKAEKIDTLQFEPDLFLDSAAYTRKEKVENNINTDNCAELNPKLSPDGKKMYFVRDCPNSKQQQQIWISEGSLDFWNNPVEVSEPLNNNGNNFVVSTSLDPNVLYLGNSYSDKAEATGSGLSKSNWLDEKKQWSVPEKVELPALLNNGEIENYCISPDQQTIIIAMERTDAIGKMDLYVSLYNKYKKTWEQPVNMGSDINSEFIEDFPYISFDDQTLFFSSNGQIGYGGYDVYISKRLDNTWLKWSKPKNLGAIVNSKTDDFGFTASASGDVAYFSTVSLDAKNHNIDIYKLKLPKPLQQPALTLLEGKVTNQKNGVPVKAAITLKNLNKKKADQPVLTTNSEGRFSEILQHGYEYEIEIEAPKFFKISEKISLTDDSQKGSFLKTYKLQPFLDSGQVAVLQNIQFEYSSTVFTQNSASALEDLYKILAEQKNMIVEISGHTDDSGSDTFNIKLSRWRAAAVVDYLVGKGIRAWRLKSVGYGEIRPIAANDTDEGKSLNRRVEMVILEDDFTKKYKKQKKEKSKTKGSLVYLNATGENSASR
ncbi:MAG: OmpA family protein [Cytophagales bacterium]